MRLLIAEDEKKTSAFLRRGLTENNFVVDVADQGDQALFLANTGVYDLIVLDVMLPKTDGWSILSELRKNENPVPVLFLTARDSTDDRVKGLELGADDYLVKPFAFSELLARIRTILRRGTSIQPDILKISDLEIHLTHHSASRSGEYLDLTPKEFLLLALLARRKGEVLSRTYIAEQIWDINFESDTNVVDVAVRRLRRKVDDPFLIPLIHTVRGVGYVLEDQQHDSKQDLA